VTAMARKRVAVLISGRGSNMASLIAAAAASGYPADIALVVSNRGDAAGLAHAQAAGIETAVVSHRDFGTNREAFEQAIQDTLERHRVELICLAGFMRVLTPWFIRRWEGALLNIHPSLLPSFKGLDTHARALQAGVRIHGASVHFVTAELDSGPIIMQAAVPVLDRDTPATLAARVLAAEHRIYPAALRLVCEQHVRLVDGRCVVDVAAVEGVMLVAPDAE